ncbi:MAG: RluA family pseudouridine synthase [Tannerellaceae bacterium]|nr:RluA family pseudouridine synthase [Tannerellaceae bacterium]
MARGTKRRYRGHSGSPRGWNVTVKENNTLLAFLFQVLKDQSKSSVKGLLKHGQISVNGRVMTQFNTPLEAGDIVSISYERGRVEFNHPKVQVLWEDDFLILVNKKDGILTVGNSKVKERTVLLLLEQYVKKNDPRSKVFVLNALEREASGLLLFAKTRAMQQIFQSSWNHVVTEHTYVVVVEGQPEKQTDLLTSSGENLYDGKVILAGAAGKTASIVRYQMTRTNGRYSWLELKQEAGSRNEIRYLLGAIGHPVAGDPKNGSESNPLGRLALHADHICFIHPETQEELCFESLPPASFKTLVKKND